MHNSYPTTRSVKNNVACVSLEGLQLPKILYKIVQSLKFSKVCKIVMKDCNLA